MTTNILPPPEDNPKRCYNCGEAESACECPAEEPVNLDAWRAEAGEAAEALAITAAIADGPWTDEALAAWAVEARTGWPRDAARVGVLCAEVATLRARVAEQDAILEEHKHAAWERSERD